MKRVHSTKEILIRVTAPLMHDHRPTAGTSAAHAKEKLIMIPPEKKTMSKFVFEAAAVLELLAHAKAAPRTVSPYGLTPDPGPE
jgi:hypothetical protein